MLIIIYLGTWTKNVFDNTMSQYKAMITKWFLGTGGGDGRSTFFENWDEAKLTRYNIDPEDYDHTNMSDRPSILIDNYHTNKIPYLTMIYLWDEKVNFLLSSRYDPLNTGNGEAGIPRDDDDDNDGVIVASPSRARKRSPSKNNTKKGMNNNNDATISEGMLALVSLMKANTKEGKKMPAVTGSKLSLQDLNNLYDKHVSHLAFLKDNGLLTEKKKKSIVRNIEEVYESITNWHGVSKRSRQSDSDSDEILNNSNSKVS